MFGSPGNRGKPVRPFVSPVTDFLARRSSGKMPGTALMEPQAGASPRRRRSSHFSPLPPTVARNMERSENIDERKEDGESGDMSRIRKRIAVPLITATSASTISTDIQVAWTVHSDPGSPSPAGAVDANVMVLHLSASGLPTFMFWGSGS